MPVASMVAMHPRPWSTSSEGSSRKMLTLHNALKSTGVSLEQCVLLIYVYFANIMSICMTGSEAGFHLALTLMQPSAFFMSMHTKISVSFDMPAHLYLVLLLLRVRFWNLCGHHSMASPQQHVQQHSSTGLKCWMIMQMIQTIRNALALFPPCARHIRQPLICLIMLNHITGS